MIENINLDMTDFGVSMNEAIDAFKILGQSFANCQINEDSLQQLKIPTSVVYPDNAESSIEFFPSHNTITQLEARITKLEKLVDELRTNATEKTEKPKQKGDLEIFESNTLKEDDNIFNIYEELLHEPIQINWNDVIFKSEEESLW